MEKAYDLKDLGKKFKDSGLDLAEESLNIVLDNVLVWFKESAAMSETPYDNMALILLPELEKLLKAQIDKIDGKEG